MSRKKVIFVTGNERKAWQAQDVLKAFDILTEIKPLEIHEIQSDDPALITRHKAQTAFSELKQPLVISDHYWEIPALNGFPGAYMKQVGQWLEAKDFVKLMEGKEDRSIVMTETLVYIDDKQEKVFTATFKGQFIDTPKGTGINNSEQVVILEGTDKTSAEHVDAKTNSRDMKKSAWAEFGKWFKEQS